MTENFINEDFVRKHSKGAQQIEFGEDFERRTDKDKIHYLKILASSLNHAAVSLQKQNNKLNDLLFLKESQLINSKTDRTRDQIMIQRQLEAENKTKQHLLNENQDLRKQIKRLESGNIN